MQIREPTIYVFDRRINNKTFLTELKSNSWNENHPTKNPIFYFFQPGSDFCYIFLVNIWKIHFVEKDGASFIQKELSKKSYPQMSDVKKLFRRVIQKFVIQIVLSWCCSVVLGHTWLHFFCIQLYFITFEVNNSEIERVTEMEKKLFYWMTVLNIVLSSLLLN